MIRRRLTWARIGQMVWGWLTPPWKPTAAALTLFVVWQLRPVFQAATREFLNALLNPSNESDTWLRSFAVLAHRTIFVEVFVLCEVLLVGTIVVTLINFAIFAFSRVRKQLSQWLRERARRERPKPTMPEPIRLPCTPAGTSDTDVA
jgi:hypothetical protein